MIDPVAQQTYLKASNTGASDSFGWSVAASAATVVVGAPWEDSIATGVNGNQADNSTTDSGAAYVFVRDETGNWSQQAYLKASNTGASDHFGQSVAISGDTIVVGAHDESSNATGVNGNQANNSVALAGAAYVFVRSGTSWAQQAYLKASHTGVFDNFGSKVAVSGDTVVVGARYEDSSATGVNGNGADNSTADSGAAYVFVRNGVVWSQQAYLKASNTGASDLFGWTVAASGDYVVVGAFQERSNATGVNGNQADNSLQTAGAAYVFVRDGLGIWSQQAYLKASNTGNVDAFGISVAVSGDTVVVGAIGEDSAAIGVNGNQSDNNITDSGAAYVFVRDSMNAWTQQAYLKASNTGANDSFGYSVAASGDTVVIGARWEDSSATGMNGNQANNSAPDSGAAYVFVRSSTTWNQQAYLKASNTGGGDLFGWSVATSGEIVVVGAPYEYSGATGINGNQFDNSSERAGAVYELTLDSDGDGLLDIWETVGIDVNGDGTIDLTLPGANPGHKDLYVEIDAMTGHGPQQTALNDVIAAFAAAPVTNPDGTAGINLHLAVDETDLTPEDWDIMIDVDSDGYLDWPAAFDPVKSAHWGTMSQRLDANSVNVLAAKKQAYRYCIFAQTYGGGASSGIAELPGNDFIVTLGHPAWAASFTQGELKDVQAGTFMHEFGHALGLRHGGMDNIHTKPNYYSIMNYTWQVRLPASEITGPFAELLQLFRDSWQLDYSREALPTLNESSLTESTGMGGDPSFLVMAGPRTYPMGDRIVTFGGAIDWNRDGDIVDTGVHRDISWAYAHESPGQTLSGHNDWGDLQYQLSGSTDFVDGVHLSSANIEELTPDLLFTMFSASLGDMNCDGTVNGVDIKPFVLAISDPKGYATEYPACEIRNGDVSGDILIDESDIAPFAERLLNESNP
ncbi:hypothetical protein B7486_05050 [cyanobacterium TDX16]|nr:hypothetical protein B7486_05050 [cyanobacterium TDX16]